MASSRSAGWLIAYACLVLRLSEVITVALTATPGLRLLEANICRNYYRQFDPKVIDLDDNVPEELCKISEVQAQLSHVSGLINVFALLPAVLAALPYLSKRHTRNRSWTLFINVLGSLASYIYMMTILYFYNTFDPRWLWLTSMLSFIGGGDLVFYSFIQSLIAESIEQEALSSFYIYSSAATLAIKVLGSAASLYMMKSSAWLPLGLSIGTKMLGIPIVLVFLRNLPNRTEEIKDDSPLISPDATELPPTGQATRPRLSRKSESLWSSFSEQRSTFLKFIFPLGMFSLRQTGVSINTVIPLWFSRRYQITLREVGWIQLGCSLITALMVSALPKLSKYVHNLYGKTDTRGRDLNLARISLIFEIIGGILLGFSWQKVSGIVAILIMSGGTAFDPAYISVMTADMEKDEIPQVYVVLEIVTLAAFSIGSWAVSDLYAICLELGDVWETSLPIWTCVVPVAVCLYYIR